MVISAAHELVYWVLLVELAPPTALSSWGQFSSLYPAPSPRHFSFTSDFIVLLKWRQIGDPDWWSVIVLLKWRQNWGSRLINLCHGDFWFYCTVKMTGVIEIDALVSWWWWLVILLHMILCHGDLQFYCIVETKTKLMLGITHLMTSVWLQPKGADRKHKTDREKMEKRSEAEKVSADAAFCCVHGIIIDAEPSGWERTCCL